MSPLLVGVGNEWRGDDAAGLEVARRVRAAAPAGLRVTLHEGEPAGLLQAWEGEADVVVVDAVSSGAPAGTVHQLDPIAEPLPGDLFLASTHHLSVPEAVELARALDRLPERLEIVGIEAGEVGWGRGLTPQVGRAVEGVVTELLGRLS